MHDANIVATMQACGIRRLLTFNTADFARFAQLILLVDTQAVQLRWARARSLDWSAPATLWKRLH